MNAILIAGAALVGLPILLHLIMKQEPKRLTFPAFRFLKQKLKTNQRKLRLRHFVLLALRMLLIALFCLTLYQPTFKSERFNIQGDQPVAVVIVIDTTPSMGYVANNESRLDEARRRALELLKELPDKSVVAVVDTADLTGNWLPDVAAARRRIEELKETKGGQPVTSAVVVAYQLLAGVEKETDAAEALPKLVAVFTDRTAASWDAGRTDDLKKLRDTVPAPKPAHVVFDFGVDAPANVGILAAEMKPQVVAADKPAIVTVTVGAAGGDGTTAAATVLAKPLWAAKPESFTASRDAAVPAGQTRTVTFEFRDLKPGLHQVEFSLKAPDKLATDNNRYLTFKVGESRRILTVTDDPDGAAFWQAAHAARDEFSCLVVRPDQVEVGDGGAIIVRYAPDPKKPDVTVADDLRAFEVVCLLGVKNPQLANPARPADGTLWDRLRPALRTGGKLIVIPPPDTNIDTAGYNAATDLMPGTLKTVLRTKDLNPPPQTASSWPAPRDGTSGVAWVLDENALKHPMFKIIEDWRQQKTNLDVLANPRLTRKFWDVDADRGATPVVFYRDAEAADKRHPAILERPVLDPKDNNRPKGKVLLLTVRMDIPPKGDEWHDYWEQDSTFFGSFPYMLERYLAGDTADANFNHPTGATVVVPLPRGRFPRDSKVIMDGPPGVFSGTDALVTPGEKQAEIRVGPPKTSVPGNFALSVEKDRAVVWKDGFSANVPADEFNLEKVPVEAVEELVGKDRVVPVDRATPLRELIVSGTGVPVDLFPWLLIAVLLLFVAEGLAANRFYRRPKP